MTKRLSVALVFVAFACATAGCGEDEPGHSAGAATEVKGNALCEDAETDSEGAPQEPATPPPQTSMEIEVRVAGTGTLSGLDTPQCVADGTSGSFHGLFAGTGEIGSDGAYVAGFAEGEGIFTTPSIECEIPELSIGALTEVVIVAKLQNTTQNCETYCEAKARSVAESECEGSLEQSTCRSAVEGEYAASCETQCTGTTTRRITAELTANAVTNTALLLDLNARELTAGAFGEIDASLTFAQIREDNGDGAIVVEGP